MAQRKNTLLFVVLVASAAASVAAQEAQQYACPAPGAPVAEPYRWYPSLDLARIPFHAGAGPWGPRARITAPLPPVTTRNVIVNSAAELAAEARVPGTRVTVAAQFIGPVTVLGDVSDVDIVVPTGHRIAQLTIGRYAPPSTTQRVRIRGNTPGKHSGGLLGKVTFASTAAITDVIIDGVDLNGDDGNGGHLLWHFMGRAERVAIINNRGHSAGPGSLDQRGGADIVIAGNRLMSGARPREVNGVPEGWGIRAGGRIVVYGNRIDGTRYHRVRLHPEAGPPQYAWVADNIFVDRYEARIFSVFNASPTTSYRYGAVWAICNQVHAHSKCISPSFDGIHANYAILANNAFFGSTTLEMQRSRQAAHGRDHDYLTGNTFSPWQEPPAWQSPGDPISNVPLPAVVPSRYNPAAAAGVGVCPPPS